MGWIDRLLGKPHGAGVDALYAALVARAREPRWYLDGRVPDTIDGRFDMIAALLSLLLLRLEGDPAAAESSAHLTEAFITDMDGQLREIGIGDIVVGKHIGKMMGMLGGRLGAFRDAIDGGDFTAAVERNVWRGSPPDAAAVGYVATSMHAFVAALAAVPMADLLTGKLP